MSKRDVMDRLSILKEREGIMGPNPRPYIFIVYDSIFLNYILVMC